MTRSFLATAVVITVGIAGVGCAASNRSTSSPVAMAASAGFDLTPNPNTPKTAQGAAIKAAEAAWAPPPGAVINAYSYVATSTSQHGFTTAAVAADQSLSMLEEPLQKEVVGCPLHGCGIGVPIWLVSYTHVDVTGPSQFRGGGAPHYHAVNILVDANTGIVFESFTSPGKA